MEVSITPNYIKLDLSTHREELEKLEILQRTIKVLKNYRAKI